MQSDFAIRDAILRLEGGDFESNSNSDGEMSVGSELESYSNENQNQNQNQNQNPKQKIQKGQKRKLKASPSIPFKYIKTSKINRNLNLTSDDDTSCDDLSDEKLKNMEELDYNSITEETYQSDLEGINPPSGNENNDLREALKIAQCNNQKESCYFCDYIIEKNVNYTKPIKILCNMFYDNYTTMNVQVLAKQMHTYFKEFIWEPASNTANPLPMWRTKTILAHIKDHTPDPKIFLAEKIKQYKKMSKVLRKMIWQVECNENSPSIEILSANKDHFKILMNVDKLTLTLYNQKISSMNFCTKKQGVNFPMTSNFVKISKK